MLFLLLAILSSSLISIFMRVSGDRITANRSMLAVNYLVCSLLGGLYAGAPLIDTGAEGFSVTLGLGFLSGVLLLTSFLLFQSSIRKNGVVLSALFMKLGLLVPILLSVVVFREVPTLLQAAGFCLAVGAILLINWNPSAEGPRVFGLNLLALLLLGGCADGMAKVFESLGPAPLADHFLFFSFATALLLCLGLVWKGRERPGTWELLFGLLIGIPNFFSSKFLLAALGSIPAVVVYPTFSVATILVVTLTGVAVFRETLTRRQWVALAAILAALVMLNL